MNPDLPPCAHRLLLDQLAALIARLDPVGYRHLCPRLDSGSPGGHVRFTEESALSHLPAVEAILKLHALCHENL